MKFLKYLLFFLIALTILFFACGLVCPSVKYGHEIKVGKSLKEAWAVTQDDSKYDQWLEGFKSMELISGEKNAVGSKYKVIVNPGEGQPDFEMIETVVNIEEFDHVDLAFDSEMMDFKQTISFSKSGDSTIVKTDSDVLGKGLVMRSMFCWMEIIGGSFQSQEEKNIEALKSVIEENTTDYYPVSAAVDSLGTIVE